MTLETTSRTQAKAEKRDRAKSSQSRGEHDDIVDRFLGEVRRTFPDAKDDELDQLGDRLRGEFAGNRAYVRRQPADAREARLDQFRSVFNGRNVAETARILGIGRATVYRLAKTAGRLPV